MTRDPKSTRAASLLAFLRAVAVCATFFAALVSVLIILNFVRTRSADPLNMSAMQSLRNALRADPANEALKDQIRALDLLARRAFFSGMDFAGAGAWLLLGSAALALAAFRLIVSLEARTPSPAKYTGPDETVAAEKRKAWPIIIGAGLALVLTALVIGRHTRPADYTLAPDAQPAFAAVSQENAAGFPSTDELRKNWPFFRGAEANGIAYETNPPSSWNAATGAGIAWKAPIPLGGYSSPVVWSNRVFLTGCDATNREVYCFDAADGRLAWRHPASGIPGSPSKLPEVTSDTGYAAPTAATDGRRVYAIFATGDLLAVDFGGKRVWAKNLGVPDNPYGHSSSLVVFRNLLLVQYDHNAKAGVHAFDAATGKELWSTLRKDIAWGTPVCVNTGSRDELILTCNTGVDSYDPLTGRRLWGEKCLTAEVGTSAGFADGMVFAANEYTVAAGIRIGQKGDAAPSAVLWTYDEDLPEVASPLAADGRVFLASAGGAITCLDAKTGKRLWRQQFNNKGFYASPILAGGRVYALERAGAMHIFDADSAYVDRGQCTVSESGMATPAFVGGRIYLRGKQNLFCIGPASPQQ